MEDYRIYAYRIIHNISANRNFHLSEGREILILILYILCLLGTNNWKLSLIITEIDVQFFSDLIRPSGSANVLLIHPLCSLFLQKAELHLTKIRIV